jgi:hypothetical protein
LAVVNDGDVPTVFEKFRRAILGSIVDGQNVSGIANDLVKHTVDVLDFVVNRDCGQPARHRIYRSRRGRKLAWIVDGREARSTIIRLIVLISLL